MLYYLKKYLATFSGEESSSSPNIDSLANFVGSVPSSGVEQPFSTEEDLLDKLGDHAFENDAGDDSMDSDDQPDGPAGQSEIKGSDISTVLSFVKGHTEPMQVTIAPTGLQRATTRVYADRPLNTPVSLSVCIVLVSMH